MDNLFPEKGVLAEIVKRFRNNLPPAGTTINCEAEYADEYRMLYKQTNMRLITHIRGAKIHLFFAFRKVGDETELYGYVLCGERQQDVISSATFSRKMGATLGSSELHMKVLKHIPKALRPDQWEALGAIVKEVIDAAQVHRAIDSAMRNAEQAKVGLTLDQLRAVGEQPVILDSVGVIEQETRLSTSEIAILKQVRYDDVRSCFEGPLFAEDQFTEEELRMAQVLKHFIHSAKKARKKGRK